MMDLSQCSRVTHWYVFNCLLSTVQLCVKDEKDEPGCVFTDVTATPHKTKHRKTATTVHLKITFVTLSAQLMQLRFSFRDRLVLSGTELHR